MNKLGIFSNHLVLTSINETHPRTPVPGIILINDTKIVDVQLSTEGLESLKLRFADYLIHDYSSYYTSPGLIDLNIRQEWEDLSALTQTAVSGGVTLTLIERGYYVAHPEPESLYCDIGYIECVDDKFSIESLNPSTLAIKAYFFPPAPNVKTVANLANFMKVINNNKLRLFIDPTLPDLRLLYMASPMRLYPIEDRNGSKPNENTFFAAAFPTDIISSDSESVSSGEILDESPDVETEKKRKMSLFVEDVPVHHRKKRSVSDDDPNIVPHLPQLMPTESDKNFIRGKKKHSTTHDIYNDLDQRIKACQNDMKDLSIAEESTYSRSGSTSFMVEPLPKKCFSMSLSPSAFERTIEPEPHSAIVPTSSSRHQARKELLRPSTITIQRENKSETCYAHHLANYPEHWEVAGIEKIVEHLDIGSLVHFQNISSVGALNRIRQLKQKFKNVTCEIPAAHLYFNSDSVPNGDTRFKNVPPIRNRGNFNLLWDLLKFKGIDLISSQHANIDPVHKPVGNFQQALNGIASIGCSLQAVWTILNIPITRKELLEHYIVRLAKWMSLHPAKVLGVDKERGTIEAGKIADLVVWDPWERSKADQQQIKYKSPFVGQDFLGVIKCVYVKGKLVTGNDVKNGQVLERN